MCVYAGQVLSAAAINDAPAAVVTRLLEPLRRPRHRLLLDDTAAPNETKAEGAQHAIMETGLFDQSEWGGGREPGGWLGATSQAAWPIPSAGLLPPNCPCPTIPHPPCPAECSLMHRALVAGAVLVPAADNLQPDPVACCQSCLANAACTAWVYCPVEGGCIADESLMLATAEAAANSTRAAARAAAAGPVPAAAAELWAPHLGCRLLSLPPFTLRKDSPQIVAKGEGVPFISGGARGGRPCAGPCPACRPGLPA